jgi:hypothetical protein
MPRWNYPSRNIRKVPKKNSVEIQKERINQMLDTIFVAKEITRFDLQKTLGWGDGIYERIARIVVHQYDNEAKWDKKNQSWIHVPIIQHDSPSTQSKEENIESSISNCKEHPVPQMAQERLLSKGNGSDD